MNRVGYPAGLERVIVTANPLDAAVLHGHGFVNGVGLGGRGTDPIVVRELVEANGVREVFVLRLEDGDAAAPILAALASGAFAVHPIAIEAPSLLDYFERCSPEEFEVRLAGTSPARVQPNGPHRFGRGSSRTSSSRPTDSW
ncbi:MAG: hypothetical protein IPK07_30590 [Deltaproteobacteria bacterium]|nr:hypothetical protein [Deltaproteobacteria bacterium]